MPSFPRGLAVVVPAYNEESAIGQTLNALYQQQLYDPALHVVVNNASTDNTREVVTAFGCKHDGFPLTIVDEAEKGTGRAADTGFRYAIDQGYQLIARTDADTLPKQNWAQTIVDNLGSTPQLQLLSGNQLPRHDDEWYRRRDRILWPLGIAVGRYVSWGNRGTGVVIGNNMATTAAAYTEVGGFPRTKIEEIDEDRAYERKVTERYGKDAVRLALNMQVYTSMRRLRSLGYMGLARYRLNPDSRKQLAAVDFRAPVPLGAAENCNGYLGSVVTPDYMVVKSFNFQ